MAASTSLELKTMRKLRQLDSMISEEQRAIRRTADILSAMVPRTLTVRKHSGPLNSHPECEFLAAVKSGNGALISSFLIDPAFDVNIADANGSCPLQTAVEDHPDLVALLLPRANLAQIRRALFSAIRKDSVSLTNELLRSPLLNDPSNVRLLSHVSMFAARQLDCFKIRCHSCDIHSATHSSSKLSIRYAERYDSPMVLAAIRGCLDIVRPLVIKGFTIPRPHRYLCTCSECVTAKLEDFIHFSRMRMLIYTAFCSDVFLFLTTSDPVVASFELSQEMQCLAQTEQERSTEFEKLADNAGKLAVNLLEQCRDSTETIGILSRGAISTRVDKLSLEAFEVIRLAIKYRQKEFIAHHLTQRFLDMKWNYGLPSIRLINADILKVVSLVAIFLLGPIRAILYIMMPYWPFSQWFRSIKFIFRSPRLKFIDHVMSHVAFLVAMSVRSAVYSPGVLGWLSLACRRNVQLTSDILLPLIYDVTLCSWVIGFIAMQIRETLAMSCRMSARSRWHFRQDAWSSISWLVMAVYLLAGISYGILAAVVGYHPLYNTLYCNVDGDNNSNSSIFRGNALQHGPSLIHQTPFACGILTHIRQHDYSWLQQIYWDPSEMANALLGVASLLSFALLISYLPIIAYIGPIVVTFQRMTADLVASFVACAMLTLAFVIAISTVYNNYQCMDADFNKPILIAEMLFAALFGIDGSSTANINVPRTQKRNLSDEAVTLLKKHSGPSEAIGFFLWALYLISVVLVLVTLLKLLTLDTFSRTFAFQRDIEWKFVRTELRLKFYGDFNALSSPFNLLEYAHEAIRWFGERRWRSHVSSTMLHSVSQNSIEAQNVWWSSEAGKWQHWQSWIPIGTPGKIYTQTCQLLVERYLHRNENLAAAGEKTSEMLEKIERKLFVYRRELRRVTAVIAAELAKSTAAINAECDFDGEDTSPQTPSSPNNNNAIETNDNSDPSANVPIPVV